MLAGSLDDKVREIVAQCRSHNVPVLFSLTRRKLGHVCINRNTACVAVINYSSAEVSCRIKVFQT